MKILLITDYGVPVGGAEIQVVHLRDALRARGHDARVFTSSARPVPGSGAADYECFGTTSRWRTLLQTANPFAYTRLRRVLSDFRPDAVHVFVFLTQLSPLILPLLRGVPSIYSAVWYRAVCPVGIKLMPDRSECHVRAGRVCHRAGCLPLRDWVLLMMQRRLWRRWRAAFDAVVPISLAVERSLAADGIPSAGVISPGVPATPSRGRLESPPTAGFAGRLVPEKGVDVLVRAFAHVVDEVSDARLLLVGDGPERARLERLVRDRGLEGHVEMPGRLANPELERRLASVWVQVVPSLAEGFGLVAAEAMMRGTAVVASATGGLEEIVRPRTAGALVAPNDPESLAKALVALLRSPEAAERMGRAARAIALAEYAEDRYTDRLLELYRGVQVGRPGRGADDGG